MVMGAVFAAYFVRRGRLGPLIVAHVALDLVSFLGPEFLPDSWLVALRLA
jgi:membrane protease YdiL (CAAX protease family)